MKRALLLTITLFLTICQICSQNTKGVDEEIMLASINDLRTDGCMCGMEEVKSVSPLYWDKDLADIALQYAIHLKNNNLESNDTFMFMSHVGLDGSTVESRLQEAGFETKNVLENIAFMRGEENLVIDYWLNNPLSCKNLMDKKMNVMGAGRAGNYWVLLLAQVAKNKNKKEKNKQKH